MERRSAPPSEAAESRGALSSALAGAARSGGSRSSLRSELLFNLAFLAAAALLLGLGTVSVLSLPIFTGSSATYLWAAIFAADLLIFVALGSYLIERLVLRPISGAAAAAEAIAAGDYARRVPPGSTLEMQTLATALNRLTDQLLHERELLAENVRSLDETNRLLVATQRDLIQAEKLASIGRLAAGVAHEIGNPLGAMIGYVEVQRRRGGDPELVDGMQREALRIDRIVRELLAYARPAPQGEEAIDVGAIIREALALLARQGHLSGLELRADVPNGLPAVAADRHTIEQIFINLFLNAEAAMQGQGRLTVVASATRFRPNEEAPARRASDPPGVNYTHLRRLRYGAHRDGSRLEPGDQVVRVVVADTGPGIRPDHIDSIFDPFFTTKAPGEGTGLGLAIVASTMAELGGRVEVTSAEGGGATFTLQFPVREEDA